MAEQQYSLRNGGSYYATQAQTKTYGIETVSVFGCILWNILSNEWINWTHASAGFGRLMEL